MKQCTNCGTQFDDNVQFCPNCGQAAANQTAANQGAQYNAQGAPNAAQNGAQGNYQQYAGAPYGYAPQYVPNPYDHTAEFSAQDVSENKPYALLLYISGIIGIVVCLLLKSDSAFLKFHLKQAVKIFVTQALVLMFGALLAFTIIVPLAAAVCTVILFVIQLICFFRVCGGKSVEPPIVAGLSFLK